jgi:hypothetical protein
MGDISRLIGNDGYICLGELGTALDGDGTKTFEDLGGDTDYAFYQVTDIANSGSFFDWTGAEVGDYFWAKGSNIMADGDSARELPTSSLESIKSFEISLSKEKIDVTTLVDSLKTYRMGKADASGSMTGVTTIGEETISDRFLDRLAVTDKSTGPTYTITRKSGDAAYIVGFLQGEETSGETVVAIVGKVEFESFNYGASDGSAQEFTTSFAPTSGDKLQKITIEW